MHLAQDRWEPWKRRLRLACGNLEIPPLVYWKRKTRPWHVLPACRHADGTISSSSVLDVRRMASEDSEQLSPGLLAVHRLGDLHDLREPLEREVTARIDHFDALRELLEVALL